MSLRASAVAELTAWHPTEPDQEALRQAYLAFLTAAPDACERACDAGHLTASAVVLSADGRRTCLVHHKIVRAWLAPGGHLEDDPSLAAAALREATEETGIAGLAIDPAPLTLNCHPIACRGRSSQTRHLDVRFLAVAPAGAQPVTSDESNDVRWFDVAELPEVFPEVRLLVEAAVQRQTAVAATARPGSDAIDHPTP